MNLFLHQNGQQTGPFTEDQLRQMLQTGAITASALCWKEGMADWAALSSVLPASGLPVMPPPPPAPKRSPLGTTSFVLGIVSVVGWVILLGIVGFYNSRGPVSETFNMIVGLFLLGGVGVNFLAVVLGLIGAFKSKANTLAIIGACLNGFLILALIGLVLLGLATKAAH